MNGEINLSLSLSPAPKLQNATPILLQFTSKIKTPTPVFTPVTRRIFANFAITMLSKLQAYVKFHASEITCV